MQTTTIRVSEPRELLALIPFQLGFEPRESAVLVSVRASRQVGLVARVDLPDIAHPASGPQTARSLLSHLVADGARSAVLVLYTAADLRSGEGAVTADRVRAHVEEAARPFLTDLVCWAVGPDSYYEPTCHDTGCCPPAGRPLADLESAAVSAEMVLTGAQVLSSRNALGQITPAGADRRRSARRAGQRWSSRLAAARGGTEVDRWRRDGLALWRAELAAAEARVADHERGAREEGERHRERPSSADLGRLHAALQDVLVRDAVMLGFIAGTDRVADRVVAGASGEDVGEVLRLIVDPDRGVPPQEQRTGAARELLEQVVAHAPRRAQGPALTLLAVLAWWHGDGARASVLCERAVDVAPDHRLALLLDEALVQGMPPGWLRRAS